MPTVSEANRLRHFSLLLESRDADVSFSISDGSYVVTNFASFRWTVSDQ